MLGSSQGHQAKPPLPQLQHTSSAHLGEPGLTLLGVTGTPLTLPMTLSTHYSSHPCSFSPKVPGTLPRGLSLVVWGTLGHKCQTVWGPAFNQ